MTQTLQPLLHDSAVLLAAPSQAWSANNGDMFGRGIQGFYHSDVRVLSEIDLIVGGEPTEHIATTSDGPRTSTFTSLARHIDDHTADPRVRIDRQRSIAPGSLTETLILANALSEPLTTTISVSVRADFNDMQTVKAGLRDNNEGIATRASGDSVNFATPSLTAVLYAPGATVVATDSAASVSWEMTVPAGESHSVRWSVDVRDDAAVVHGAAKTTAWSGVEIDSGDSRLSSWVHAALKDLESLRMVTLDHPDEVFLAAGAPWFFTLFGRDSIWAARMLLPFGTETAASTLRVLAALQGTREDNQTAEQPGKIMHELRAKTLIIPGENVSLPPLYYGTVDATALWVNLLHDAWKWGMPDAEVEQLLPHLEAALGWLRDFGDSDGDGLIEYADTTGHGLANQGWKDSGDSIQWRDGSLAEGPIALCEVQAYAYEAAMGGAALLEHFGRPGEGWRSWAADLKDRFNESFWIGSPDGAYPAVALDANKQKVDTVTSNIGHLLGTGILDAAQSKLVAQRLSSPEMNSGFGLRTMSTDSAGYWPLSYHGGSVWAHDTAIAISGLISEGFREEAAALIEGLLNAAEGFDYRMPELHSGDSSATASSPIPYPASCQPQAWSAAASVGVLSALLGLRADAQAGNLQVEPLNTVAPISVQGLSFAGQPLTVTVAADGSVTRS
ncbi:glycogen debranching N-terminal domain-containing protein [Paenarthrobacter sp. NPDC056912]|uniref:amylo-alpha-1,6-glucosidase n=1 Tax=Paenarthrobacter sp. NPDC056912 TaxID=3345965 RepID=UPI00366C0ADA